jgi:5-amino-6-(D-ribitylamino)uracil---L-tyrosine 4-hydroxyphenyl transferase
MAGAKGGTSLSVADLQGAIRDLDRAYAQRSTLYELI